MPRYIGAYRGGVRPSAPTTVYRTCALSLPCHSEPVTDVTGVGIRSPRPQARNLQSLPCVKGGVARRATEELLSPGGAEPRPYTRLSRRVPTTACGHAALRIICGGKTFPTSGQRPPPTFAASRQRRDLIIANPRRVFPKREGRSPPSLVAQGWGIFKGEGRSKLPSPLNGAFGYFCRY